METDREMKNKKSLTLIEIVISLVIFSLVMAGLTNVFFAAKRYIIYNRSLMTGGELGKLFLDPLQMDVRQDTWDQAGNRLNVGTFTDTSIASIAGRKYDAAYEVSEPLLDIRKVKVDITWTE